MRSARNNCSILLVLLRAHKIHLGLIVVLTIWGSISVLRWSQSWFIFPGVDGWGELFEAYHGALNIDRFGWKWAGLQDMATSANLESHPYLYVHHPNFGIYFSLLLRNIGITSVEAQNFASGLGSAFFIVLAYLFIRRETYSDPLALFFVSLICLNTSFITIWAFNIHRSFSLLAMTGVLYSFLKLKDLEFGSVTWSLILFIFCVMLVGADYMFFFYTYIFIAIYIWLVRRQFFYRSMIILLGFYGFVFALRQTQVLVGLGYDKWKNDLLYQTLNRFHKEYLFSGDWARVTTDFYADNFILNPGFAPSVTWAVRINEFILSLGRAFVENILLHQSPSELACIAVGLTLTVGSIVVIGYEYLRIRQQLKAVFPAARAISITAIGITCAGASIGAIANWTHFLPTSALPIGAVCLVLTIFVIVTLVRLSPLHVPIESSQRIIALGSACLLACIAMYTLFPAYFTQWYPSFQLDLFTASLATLILYCPATITLPRAKVVNVLSAFIVIRGLAVAPLAVPDTREVSDHAAALRNLKGKVVVSNFTPASIASYTNSASGWIKPEAVERLLKTGQIEPSDYFMLFERDKNSLSYKRPEYFFIFKAVAPIDQLVMLRKQGFAPLKEGNTYALFRLQR